MIKKLTIDEYNALPGCRYSILKHAQRSLLHYFYAESCGRPPAQYLAFGDMCHGGVFEPTTFDDRFVVYPGAVRRGAKFDEFAAENAGRNIVTENEMGMALAISEAVLTDPVVRGERLITHGAGLAEVSMTWTDPETGLECKGRLDWLDESGKVPLIVGLKTTKSVNERAFATQAAQLCYHLQWAMYEEGYCFNRPESPTPRMIEIVVEKEPPFDVVVYEIGLETLAAGAKLYHECLRKVAGATKSNSWPGQGGNSVREFELPAWATVGESVELDLGGLTEQSAEQD